MTNLKFSSRRKSLIKYSARVQYPPIQWTRSVYRHCYED